MPLFGYYCEACKTHSEILVRGEETPVCPECGSKQLEKQMSHFAPVSGGGAPDMPPCAAGGGCPSGGCPFN